MNAKVVTASLAAIIAVAVVVTLFADVKREDAFARVESVDVRVESVNDSYVVLNFEITVKRSKTLRNSTILAKVYDFKTNVLLTEISRKVPEKTRSEYHEIDLSIPLEKSREYRVALSIVKDHGILDSRELKLTHLDTILPEDKQLKVVLKDADFEVRKVNGKAEVFVRFYVEALKDYQVLAHVKAVQYESNLLVDEIWENVSLKGGKTTLIEGNVSVPKNYNYLVKLELWKNGSLLKTWSKPLNLAPVKKIPKNVTEEEVKFEVEEFVKTPVPTPRLEYAERKAVPGFEVVALILAGGVALWRRRSN